MTNDDIRKENPRDGWYRRKIGRRIELGANLLAGMFTASLGIVALGIALAGGLDPGVDWPLLSLAAAMLLLARYCFRAKRGVIDF